MLVYSFNFFHISIKSENSQYLGTDNSEAASHSLNDGHAEGLRETRIQEDVALNEESIPNVAMTNLAKNLQLKNSSIKQILQS